MNFYDSLKAYIFALFLIIINLIAIGSFNFLLLSNNFKNYNYILLLVTFISIIAFSSRFIYNRFLLFLSFKKSNPINIIK